MEKSFSPPLPWAITARGYTATIATLLGYVPAEQGETWDEYCRQNSDRQHGLRIENGVAIQPVKGTILAGAPAEYELYCGCFNLDRLRAAVERIQGDTSISAFVLDLDTPGGYTKGMQDAVDALTGLRAARPDLRTASFCAEACSCGYWLAAAQGPIHPAPGADLGAIGVYTVTYDDSKAFASDGIEARLHADGIYKGMGTPGIPWSPEWLAWIDARVAEASAAFKGSVRAHRKGITDDTMQGQPFSGPDYPAGLADRSFDCLEDVVLSLLL